MKVYQNLIACIFFSIICVLKKVKTYNDTIVRISMIGDILMHPLATAGSFNSNPVFNFDYMFEKLQVDLQQFDVNMVNLEIVLCAQKYGIKYFPRFSNRFEIAEALVRFGYNVVLKATNHVYDYGKEGIRLELEEWKTRFPEIHVTGAYQNKMDSERITFLTKKGIQLAVINFTTMSNRRVPPENSYMVNMHRKQDKKLIKQIKDAREQGAEYLIVCMHWGKEYSNTVSRRQKELVKRLYHLGVDLVIGTHPHVIQPVEWYGEKGKDRKMLVFYSLGNYINATSKVGKGFYRVFCDGMAYIEIERNRTTGKIDTRLGKFIPLITHIDKDQDLVQTYLVQDYTPELAEENRIKNRTDSSFTYEVMITYFKNIISDEFLTFNFTTT